MSKYIYRLLSENAAVSCYTSLKALERGLEIYCQLHGNRRLVKQDVMKIHPDANTQWCYVCLDSESSFMEYPLDKDMPVNHSFYVERIEL